MNSPYVLSRHRREELVGARREAGRIVAQAGDEHRPFEAADEEAGGVAGRSVTPSSPASRPDSITPASHRSLSSKNLVTASRIRSGRVWYSAASFAVASVPDASIAARASAERLVYRSIGAVPSSALPAKW